MRSQTYDIEMRVDNLQMDMSGVELSVVNAHRQIQRVEDNVLELFMEGGYQARVDCRILEETFCTKIDDLEFAKEKTDERCENIWEVLTSWMVTFEALETSVSDAAARVLHMEDHLVTRSKELLEMLETAIDQAATIRLLRDRIGELELGHGVLRARVINIKVRSMVASLRELTIYFLRVTWMLIHGSRT
jgi:hypothetical protein